MPNTPKLPEDEQAAVNTDVELWRQPTTDFGEEDGNDSGMEPSVFVTKYGGIGFNYYGTCVVMPIKQWMELATLKAQVRKEIEGLKNKHSSGQGWTNHLEIGYKDGITDCLSIPSLREEE